MGMSYKATRSQIALSLLASLLTLTPLFSSSLRLTYIYFIFNLLIIALGAEAGLLSSLLSNPNPNPNPNNSVNTNLPKEDNSEFLQKKDDIRKMESRTIQKCSSQKVVAAALKKIVQVRKCDPSTPSIFFIGGGEVDQRQERDFQRVRFEIRDKLVEVEELEDVVKGQELFTKSENFIGNFYKQLDLQRDQDSWKRTHGFYIIS